MTHPHVLDPWDAAENAQLPTYTHFGQITLLSDFVVWPKGTKLRDCPPFDPNQHKPEQRVTRITMMAVPLPGRQAPLYPHERVVPAQSREWVAVTLPSIRALNVSPRDVDGKWVQYQFKPARKYTDADGNEKDATSFHIVELYDTEGAASLASEDFFGQLQQAVKDEPIPFGDEEDVADASDNGSDPERAAMAQFLAPVWAQCNGDQTELAKKLAEMPMLSDYFTIDSPEVKAVVSG